MNARRLLNGRSLIISAMLLAAPALAADTKAAETKTAKTADSQTAETKTPAANADTKSTAAAGGPSDAQIAAIVVSANQVDVDAAKYAKGHTKNKSVKEFADTMIRDHESVNKQAKALVKKLKVKPEANDTSKSLESGGKENLAALKKLKGAEFDKAYVEHEVAYHQQVVDAINNTLIPNAKNEELKSLLEKTAPVIQAHLDHAKKLQEELGSAAK